MLKIRATSTATGTTTCTPALPTGSVADDVLILSAECNNTDSLTTPTGYTVVTGSPFVGADTKLYLWWRRFVAGDVAVAVAGSVNHVAALIVCYSGAVATGTPIESVASSIVASGTTAATFPVVTPTAAGYGVIHAGSTGFDSTVDPLPSYTTPNIDASTISKDFVATATGDGGGAFQLSGIQTGAAGPTSSTGVMSSTGAKALASMVLIPAADVNVYTFNEQFGTVLDAPANVVLTYNEQFTTILDAAADVALTYNLQFITVVDLIVSKGRRNFMSFTP